jgi:hypothetical protein
MWRRFAVVIGAAVLSACANLAARPPVPGAVQAVQNIDASLASVPHLNESDLLGDESSYRYQTSSRFIRDRQCAARTANPMLLIARPVKINLRGSIEEDGAIVFSDVGPERAGSAVKPGQQYGFEVPLQAAAVADLPREYLREISALIETKGLPAEAAEKLKKDLPETYEKLVARVDKLVNEYHPGLCPRVVVQRRPDRSRQAAMLRNVVPPTF